ncbi:MAG: HAD family hydrolase [Oscillospiraceae bacterium]|nr:HAD family hydrolase [Oscillospiraceae bacterium]
MYHKLSIEETLKSFDVNPETGLSDKEARQRTAQEKKPSDGSSFFKFARGAISRPVVYLLIITAALSAFFGGIFSAALIFSVIVLHIIYSSECRRRGSKTIDRTISTSVTHAIVLRNGAKMKLASDELVVGDIVTIKPGRVVPADLRLISSENLVIDESALTGSASAEKDCDAEIPRDVPIEFRDNCAFEGTVVIKGRGDGVVIATGMSTEMSRLTLPLDVPEKDNSPNFSRLNRLSKRLTAITACACIAVFGISIIRKAPFVETLVSSLALAVAIIPEGMFTSALVALSKGAERLKKAGFSTKSMHAAETLGEVTVFTTDIPGIGVAATYTNGRIRTPQEEDTVPFIDGLLLCETKNPSLRTYATHKCNAEKVQEDFPRIGGLSGEVTTTLHRAGSTTISYTAGDAEEILRRSKLIWELGHIRTLNDSDREDIRAAVESFNEEDFSMTALGFRSGDDVPCDTDLIFLGIVATSVQEKLPETPNTARLRSAGVRMYLLTESDAEKARLGAAALSLESTNIICGRELRAMTDDELWSRFSETFVFAGLRAQDKVRIINVLKSRGEVVASIGDSISDAPALDAADIGLSDIHAQDAAKDAADVIFDGAACADEAIVYGKVMRRCIKRCVTYLAAANTAELVCVLASVVCGLGFPMTPWQILLVNLLTDTFPAHAIASGKRLVHKSVSRFAYTWGVVLGVLCVGLHFFISRLFADTELARWAVFAALVAGELILAIPVHFMGREKNVK